MGTYPESGEFKILNSRTKIVWFTIKMFRAPTIASEYRISLKISRPLKGSRIENKPRNLL